MADIFLRTSKSGLDRSRNSYIFARVLQKIVIYIVLITWAFFAVVPFMWMLSTSVKSLGEAQGVRFFPKEIRLENYVEAWKIAEFAEYFINSVEITGITLAGEMVVSILAAYALARIKFPGRDLIFGIMLSTMMIPAMVLTIPNFLTVTWLGRIGEAICGEPCAWINNWPALTIPFWGSVFSIFLLRQFFSQIPDELYDAAQIDGAGHLRFLWKVVLPLSKAPVLVIIVLSFMGSWNSLAWPLLVAQKPEWRPIALGLYKFVQEAGQQIHLMMAGAVITIIPILLLYFITQKQFTESIARSGLKG